MTPTPSTLTPRERAKLIAEAFRKGWPFKLHPDGTLEVYPPTMQSASDPFELMDMRR